MSDCDYDKKIRKYFDDGRTFYEKHLQDEEYWIAPGWWKLKDKDRHFWCEVAKKCHAPDPPVWKNFKYDKPPFDKNGFWHGMAVGYGEENPEPKVKLWHRDDFNHGFFITYWLDGYIPSVPKDNKHNPFLEPLINHFAV